MTITLKQSGFLPGGFPYTDPITKKEFDGLKNGGFDDQVQHIATYRQSNPRIFTDTEWLKPEFIQNQLLEFQYQRLSGNPRYFVTP